MKVNYNLITELNPGSIIRVTFSDVDVEHPDGSVVKEEVTRDFMIINPGPVIQSTDPDLIYAVDMEDGMLSGFRDRNIEVYTVLKK